jgi:phage tail-like protein
MKHALPIPALDYFPRAYWDDTSMIALASRMDILFGEVEASIIAMRDRNSPEACPSQLLDELAYELAAGVLTTDSDATKRRKIATAVQVQKVRGTWEYSAKAVIDSIVMPLGSLGATLWTSWDTSAAWLLRANLAVEPLNFMASMGTDGVTANLGILLIGSGYEFEIAGNVYVDLGISTLTAEQVAQVIAAIANEIVPAYFRVTLGYVTAGQFTAYAGGIIG